MENTVYGNFFDNELGEGILEYLKGSLFNYSIMINGEWGSGKTYYATELKEELIKCFDGKEVVMLSLYGMKSIDDMELGMFFESSKIPRGLYSVAKTIKSAIPYIQDSDGSFMEEAIRNRTIDYKQHIFIFDDLERCKIPINEVFGLANALTEVGTKIIFVVNEDMLIEKELNNNIELKILPYLINPKLLDNFLSQNESSKESNDLKKEPFYKVDEELRKYFYDKLDYVLEKEKIIGSTLQFKADFNTIIKNLLKKPELKIIDIEHEIIVRTISKSQITNLRVLNRALMLVAKIYPLSRSLWDNDEKKVKESMAMMMDEIFKTYYHILQKHNDKIQGSAIAEYCRFGRFHEEAFLESIRAKIALDPLDCLNFNNVQDNGVALSQIKKFLMNIKGNKYKVSAYQKVVAKLLEIKEMGYDFDFSEYVQYLKSNMEFVTFNDRILLSDDVVIIEANLLEDESVNKFRSTMNELKNHYDGLAAKHISKSIMDLSEDEILSHIQLGIQETTDQIFSEDYIRYAVTNYNLDQIRNLKSKIRLILNSYLYRNINIKYNEIETAVNSEIKLWKVEDKFLEKREWEDMLSLIKKHIDEPRKKYW